jgi:hypothetical protein
VLKLSVQRPLGIGEFPNQVTGVTATISVALPRRPEKTRSGLNIRPLPCLIAGKMALSKPLRSWLTGPVAALQLGQHPVIVDQLPTPRLPCNFSGVKVALRKASRTPLMAFGKPKARKIQTDHLPGPIATSYRRIFTRHEPDIERLIFVLDTAEITARFLASVMLCTLRELAAVGKIEGPLIEMGDPRMRLRKPSFGLWMEILRESSRRIHGQGELFDTDASRELAMQICGYVFNEQKKTKGRPYLNLDAILVIRNKVHHPEEELDITALCGEAEGLLNDALEQLAFFEEFPLYVVKQINLRRSRMHTARYQHQCYLLQGEVDFPTAENDDRTWHTETNEVLLYRDDSSYLNLDPMFVYLHADEVEKAKPGGKNAEELYPGLYSFAGFASKSAGTVVDYLPCASSSKSFRTSNEAFRDPSIPTHLAEGVDELLNLLGTETEPELAAAET